MKIHFKKTGNFYIDNGLVALFQSIERQSEYDKDEPIDITPDEIVIELDDGDKEEYLNGILRKSIKESLTGKTKNFGWYYDAKIKELKKYQKQDWQLFAKYFFGQIAPSPEEIIKWKDADSDFQKTVDNFLQENNLSHYSKNKIPTSPMDYRLKVEFKEGKSNEQCNLCGQTLPLLPAKKYNMPFWITLDKMKTFYSNHGQPYRICSLCSLASLFAPMNTFYNISRLGSNKQESIFFMIYDDDLTEMYQFYQLLRDKATEMRQQSVYCNFKKTIITFYLKETLLAFLYEFYQALKMDEGKLEKFLINNFPTKRIIGFIGKKDGNNVSFFNLFEFTRLSELMLIFSKFTKKEIKLVPFLISFHEDIKSGGRMMDTLYREKLAERILNFDYVNDIIEEFIFKTLKRIPYLISFLKIYNQEVFIMSNKFSDEEYATIVNSCFGLGWEIGKRCYGSKEKPIKKKSFLFDIRNSKTLDEFLGKLNQIQFDLSMQLNKKIIEALALDLNNWEKYKSIICISAVNAYLSQDKPKTEGGTNNE